MSTEKHFPRGSTEASFSKAQSIPHFRAFSNATFSFSFTVASSGPIAGWESLSSIIVQIVLRLVDKIVDRIVLWWMNNWCVKCTHGALSNATLY